MKPRIHQYTGYLFQQESLVKQALTHRSFSADNNERLEFLGDSALNFIIGAALFRKFPEASEGQLSRLRAQLVKGVTLAAVAREMSLGELIRLGAGEKKAGGEKRESILEDTAEALIGAIYLDAGLDVCEKTVLRWFQPRLDALSLEGTTHKDAKSQLQEFVQAKHFSLPVYEIVEVSGEAHSQDFEVRCRIQEMGLESRGSGRSRKLAEQDSAQKILEQIGDEL